MTDRTPVFTVGIPVYNGASTVADAIESVLACGIADMEVVISDNASTDQTPSICALYAKKDKRIRYLRQASNVGAYRNFWTVLNNARSPYFIWLAADDVLQSFPFGDIRRVLERDKHTVAVAARGVFEIRGARVEDRCNGPLLGPACTRVRRLLFRPGANSRFYSVYRTEQVRGLYETTSFDYWGGDVTFSARVALLGNWAYDTSFVVRRRPGISSNPFKLRAAFGMRGLALLFPYPRFAIDIVRAAPAGCGFSIAAVAALLYVRYLISPVKHFINVARGWSRQDQRVSV